MSKIQFPAYRTWQDPTIPLVGNCDPLNPRQAFLPFFTGAVVQGAPMMFGPEIWEAMSEHLVECLGIPVVDGRLLEPIGESMGWQARRKYIPPPTVLNPALAAGQWVTMDEPDPEPEPVAEVMDRLPHHERVAIAEDVQRRLGVTPDSVMPGVVPVTGFATQCKLTVAQAVNLLKDWGIDAKPRGTIDRQVALKIFNDLQRKGQA